MLENYQFIEKITHLDRERIPSGSSMRAAPARTVGSNLSATSARSRRRSSPGAKVLTQTGVLVDGIDFSDDKMLDAPFVTRTRGVTGSALFYNELFARESSR